ncbi:MAG TPA: hypothetical protein VIC26_07180 [Marinagarivorans sp.]
MTTHNHQNAYKHWYLPSAAILTLLMTGCVATEEEAASSSSTASSVTATTSSSASPLSSSSSQASASSQGDIANYDHCLEGFRPHQTNGQISDGPVEYTAPGGQVNATVHPVVYDFMYENAWQDAHVLWHNVRACGALFGETPRPDLPDACQDVLFQPEESTCEGAQDGLEFLAGHRLMMEQLQELWPSHLEQFTGWEKFPTRADYPQFLVDAGYVSDWSSSVLQAAEIGDNIENNMDLFANEGELGTWLQCGGTPGQASGGFGGFGSLGANLHIALHGNGSPGMNVPHSVNNNNQNLDAYLFWKLHGWIDNVWERYRAAKGKTRNDEDYKQEMLNQCREMDHWRDISLASRDPNTEPNPDGPNPETGLPEESGYFHDVVRPAIENGGCLNCHGDIPNSNSLQLGGQITSTEIVENLLGDAVMVDEYKYVVPGNLSASWLYMKSSGESINANVTCTTGLDCRNPMPYREPLVDVLKEWIQERNAEKPIMVF